MMRILIRLGLIVSFLGGAAILEAGVASAAPLLMSGNVKLQTLPTVTRDYDDYGVVDVQPTGGTGPATMVVPQSFFQADGTQFRVFTLAPHVAQVTSSFTSFNLSETLMAGGGPGDFTFCPGVANPINPLCTQPSQATGGLNNFLQYESGVNQFGGTFRVLRQQISASGSFRVALSPDIYSHQLGDTVARIWPGGAPSSSTQFIQRAGGVQTSGAIIGPFGSIQTPGVVVGTGPTPAASRNTGFPATTGMVVVRDTNPSPLGFTLTGSDTRTPAGSGQIMLVGSGVAQASTGRDFGRQLTVSFVPEPGSTALFVAGLLGLGALYSQRGRLL